MREAVRGEHAVETATAVPPSSLDAEIAPSEALAARLRRLINFCRAQQRELGLSDTDLRVCAEAESELTMALVKFRKTPDAARLADCRLCHAHAEAMLGAILVMVDGRPQVRPEDKRSLRELIDLSPASAPLHLSQESNGDGMLRRVVRQHLWEVAWAPVEQLPSDAPAWRRLLLDVAWVPA